MKKFNEKVFVLRAEKLLNDIVDCVDREGEMSNKALAMFHVRTFLKSFMPKNKKRAAPERGDSK